MAMAATASAMTQPIRRPVLKFQAKNLRMSSLPRGASDLRPLMNDDLGADGNSVVEIGHVRIGQAEASRRHLGADGPRLVGAMDAVDRGAEVERAGAERIAGAAGHPARQIGLALDHFV